VEGEALGASLGSALILPLLARSRMLGVLVLVRGASNPCYGQADLALAEDLAGRAAIALDNARLHENIHEQDQRKKQLPGDAGARAAQSPGAYPQRRRADAPYRAV
jgi:GAF domain-containing protein